MNEEKYQTADFEFREKDEDLEYDIVPLGNRDAVFGTVRLTRDDKEYFVLRVFEGSIMDFYAKSLRAPRLTRETNVARYIFAEELQSVVKKMFTACEKFVDSFWSRELATSYRFNLKLEIVVPQGTEFHKTTTLCNWKPSQNALIEEPLYVLSRANLVESNLVLDIDDPKQGAQDVISFLVSLLQCFDIPDTAQMMKLSRDFYFIIDRLKTSKFNYGDTILEAPSFNIELTVKPQTKSN